MPNFPPLRRYVFSVVDRWISSRGLESPFLEVGCGTGDLAVHLARRGWNGTALDSSPAALARAGKLLSEYPGISISSEGLEAIPPNSAHTVFIMDVVEHVQDDLGLLRNIATKTIPGGHLVLLTPVNPGEWGHDDEIYGHFRRYGWEEMDKRLTDAGFEVLERWNVTFPFIWLLRKLYLLMLPRGGAGGSRNQLTAASSFYNPWSRRTFLRTAGAIIGWRLWWTPLFKVQDMFAKNRHGHAAMFLARKKP